MAADASEVLAWQVRRVGEAQRLAMANFGPAVTLPTSGHMFLGSWTSPGMADG